MDENEPLDHAAARELQEETSVNPEDILLTQIGAFGDPGRWEWLAGAVACGPGLQAQLPAAGGT